VPAETDRNQIQRINLLRAQGIRKQAPVRVQIRCRPDPATVTPQDMRNADRAPYTDAAAPEVPNQNDDNTQTPHCGHLQRNGTRVTHTIPIQQTHSTAMRAPNCSSLYCRTSERHKATNATSTDAIKTGQQNPPWEESPNLAYTAHTGRHSQSGRAQERNTRKDSRTQKTAHR